MIDSLFVFAVNVDREIGWIDEKQSRKTDNRNQLLSNEQSKLKTELEHIRPHFVRDGQDSLLTQVSRLFNPIKLPSGTAINPCPTMKSQNILIDQNSPEPEKLIKGDPPLKRVYKLVLTGGPCGGKTTGQDKLASFFENLGWKVYRVPETASVLMSGGIAFGELTEEEVLLFQENLIRTMIAIEDTYFRMAEKSKQNCLIICDRGVMDASAYISKDLWQILLDRLQLTEINLCEGRYDQIVHMVSAANGAEDFYSVEDHAHRFESLELARDRDRRLMDAWRMHPYVDLVNNDKEFERKMRSLLDIVIRRVGLEVRDQIQPNSRKVKFIVAGPIPNDEDFPVNFIDFDVVHHYLQTGQEGIQSRVRKRGHRGRFTYTCTVRRPEKKGQSIEVKTPLSKRDYENLLNYIDNRHMPVYKTRRCFLYKNQHYRLDIYREPCHERCRGLVILETFSTLAKEEIISSLPPFLSVKQEVTGDPAFSMYNLALKSDWTMNADHFCDSHHRDFDDCDADGDSLEGGTLTPSKADTVRRAFSRLVSAVSGCDTPILVKTSGNSANGSDCCSDYYSSGNEM